MRSDRNIENDQIKKPYRGKRWKIHFGRCRNNE